MPLEVLGAVGLITTPKVANLVDLCSTWAKIRYIWAFDPEPLYSHSASPQPLRLSHEARSIDFHQKTLLSDEIGVGMATLVMNKFFGAHNPVDVDLVLRQGGIPGLARVEGASPDYLFCDAHTGALRVVECKGTQSGYSKVLDQLRRGTEQVRSIALPGVDVPCYVVATDLSQDYTRVYVVDPPSGGGSSKADIIVANEAQWRDALRDAQAASLYTYIGAFGRAFELEGWTRERQRVVPIQEPLAQRSVRELNTRFVGTEQTTQVPGEYGRISVFQGMPDFMYEALNRRAYDVMEDMSATYLDSLSNRIQRPEGNRDVRSGLFLANRRAQSLSVSLFQGEGTLLQITISR